MRKMIGMVLGILSFISGVYLVDYHAGNSTTYMQCMIEESEFEEIIASREEKGSILDGISFNGVDLFYDKVRGLFYYSLIEGNSQALNPCVKAVSADWENLQIAFLGSKLSREMVEENQTVEILVYTKEYYCRRYLVCTTLPLMNISSAGEIGDEDVPMELTLYDNSKGAANRVINSSGFIQIRGGYSRNYPKLGYRIRLTTESPGANSRPNQIALLGMRQDDDWLLYAGYNDQEKVRNVFSSNLWKYSCASDNKERIDAGMEYKYLELFINGEYWGLYALGYPIDKKQLGFGDDISKEALYKLKIDWIDERSVRPLEDGSISGYEQKGVDRETKEGWNLLTEHYNDLYTYHGDSDKLCERIDMDNMIDTYLFIKLIQGVDHAGKSHPYEIFNMYVAIRTDWDGSRKGLYIPWDMDRTWGNGFGDDPYNIAVDYQVPIESGYLNQLITNQDTDIWEKIFNKYWSMRSNLWSDEALSTLIDEYEADIFASGAFARDMARWPDGQYVNPGDRLEIFRQYVMDRLAETDLYIERMERMCEKSIFLRRSADYKDFEKSRFIIELHDKDLLRDQDYVDLLEYLNIEVEKITDDVHYIVAVPSVNSAEYFPSLGNCGNSIQTNAGVISLKGSSNRYSVMLDEFDCYHVDMLQARPGMKVVFVDESGRVWELDVTK